MTPTPSDTPSRGVGRALVLGGTSFVGRHTVEALLADGWSVEVFHRGRTGRDVFVGRGVRHLLGDRDGDVSALSAAVDERGGWDVCVDVTAYTPEHVARTAAVMRDRVGHVVIVSTVSVYELPLPPGADESAPVLRAARSALRDDDTGSYGPLKVLVEDAARDAFDSVSVVRPGIVAGRWDPTDRFTSWVRRLASPGRHPVPDTDRPLQWVDARDLAALIARLCDSREQVTVNAVRRPVTLGELASAVAEVAGTDSADLVVLGDEHALAVDEELGDAAAWPMWLPEHSPYAGLAQIDGSLSEAVGASYRSVHATVGDTLEWLRVARPTPRQGLSPDVERRLLDDSRPA